MDPQNILLVEDNPADSDLTCSALAVGAQNHGLAAPLVTVVANGERALDFLCKRGEHSEAQTPHFVILDLNLPRMSGSEVLEEMRSNPELKHVPVAVWTSSSDDDDVVRLYNLGANCFMTKPIGLDDFRSMVEVMLRFWFEWARLPRAVN